LLDIVEHAKGQIADWVKSPSNITKAGGVVDFAAIFEKTLNEKDPNREGEKFLKDLNDRGVGGGPGGGKLVVCCFFC
jgi:hypothetical protein